MNKTQKQELKIFEMMGEWLTLFSKGLRSTKGLDKKDKIRIRKLTDKILAYKDAQRSRS